MKNKKKLLKAINNQSGFTLTEMLIVIALIALVGTFATTQLIGRFNRAKVSATKIQMKNIGSVLNIFRVDCGFFPTTDQGLDALVEAPSGRPCKNYDPEGYFEGGKVPKDGFDFDFQYFSDGNAYEIKSFGADGQEGGEGINADVSSKDL